MISKTFCPQCESQEMREEVIHGLKVHICDKCGGLWLDKGELNGVAHPIEGDLEYCSTDHFAEDRVSDVKCPVCKEEKMVKVNFIHYTDIILDYCKKCHGLWLNRGELDAINAEIDRLHKIPESWDHRIMVFLSKLPF